MENERLTTRRLPPDAIAECREADTQCPSCHHLVRCREHVIVIAGCPNLEVLGEAAVCPRCGYAVISPSTQVAIDMLFEICAQRGGSRE
jgi:hypothetical protein